MAATHKDVFAFEGIGGFPKGWIEGNNNPPTVDADGNPTTTGTLGASSQVVNYWRAAAQDAGKNVRWYYYSQDAAGVKAAEKEIKTLATTAHGKLYDTITILGYSYGGEAALEVAQWLKGSKITVDLAVTCDPVPVWDGLKLFPYSLGGTMPTKAPANVAVWDNFYQWFDTDSLRRFNWLHWKFGVPTNVWGRAVTAANPAMTTVTNTPVTAKNFKDDPLLGQNAKVLAAASAIAHVSIPVLQMVRDKITDDRRCQN